MVENEKIVEILAEIKKELEKNNELLNGFCVRLNSNESNMWKLLVITVIGAFALVGVKIAFP